MAGVLALAAFGIGPSAAVEVHETFGPEHYATVKNPFFDIWVIEVRSVDDANATNAEPPIAQAAVLEVLRGKPVVGIVATVWDSPERLADLEDPAAGNFDLKRSWLTRPAWGPSKGDRLIVVGLRKANTGKFHVGAARVFRLTEANRAAVLRAIATPGGAEVRHNMILPVLLVIPVVGMILLLVARGAGRATRRTVRWIAVLLPAVELGLYGLYEAGISSYADIRVDLVVVWPAVAMTLLLWPATWHRTRRLKRS